MNSYLIYHINKINPRIHNLTLPRYLQSKRSLRRSVRFLWMIRWRRLCLQNWNKKEVSWLHDSSTPRNRRSRM